MGKSRGQIVIFIICVIQLALPDQGEMKSKTDVSRIHTKLNTEWKQEIKTNIQETKDIQKMKNYKINAKIKSKYKMEIIEDRELKLDLLSSNDNLDHFRDKKSIHSREIRSEIGLNSSLESQYERNCLNVGSQPCTCYYPDHTEVIHFEVGNDNITKNAFVAGDGTGPANCSDLKAIGYTLRGFYLVLLNNTKRVKPTYCDFNQTNNNTYKVSKSQALSTTQNVVVGSSLVKRLKFCGGVVGKQCTFYYSDHPDATQFLRRSNNAEPTSCEDLKSIGYSLNGYYMVRFNGIKVKTVYCNLKPTITLPKQEANKRSKRAKISPKNSPKTKFCNGVGSQPCSCYHPRFAAIQQLELSSDEITRNASSENGTGPSSCEDLALNGYRLKGFYAVRFNNRKSMKIIFCEFPYLEKVKTGKNLNDKTLESEKIKSGSIFKATPVFATIATNPKLAANNNNPTTNGPKLSIRYTWPSSLRKNIPNYPITKPKGNSLNAVMNSFNFPPGCYPVGNFKTQPSFKHQTCLAIQAGRFGNPNKIYHRTCTGESIERWVWINATYICHALENKCLTVSSNSNWNPTLNNRDYTRDLSLKLTEYSQTIKYQQWKMDRNGAIVSVGAFGTCLSYETIMNFGYKIESLIKMDYHNEVDCSVWSFNPILNISGLPKCSEFKF